MTRPLTPGRNDPCPCGSGKKLKKCHGAPSLRSTPRAHIADGLPAQATSANLPLPGVPGIQSYLVVQPVFEGPDPRNHMSPGGSPGLYRVVFTLSRPGHSLRPDRSYSFESGIEGDSHLSIAPPAYVPPNGDPQNPIVKVLLDCRTPEGSYRFEGIPNKRGFLGKIVIDQLRADDFKDAELRAFRALSSGLSNITVYLDIPLHIYQVDVTELATGTASMSLATPWMETPLFALPIDSMSPDFRFYASLYREAAGSNSPGYQFLCYYKIIEGVRVRHERSIVEARKQGLPIPSAPREFVPSTREDQVAWLNGLFPVRQAWDSLALDMVFPKEALGRKLNDVIDKELDGVRNRLAHAVLRSGEATVLIDDGHDRLVLSKWLALTKCIARALLRDEFPDVFLTEAKGPPAPPSAQGSSTPAFTRLPE